MLNIKKSKKMAVAITGGIALMSAVMLSACESRSYDDYSGTWIGITEPQSSAPLVYEFDIAPSDSGTEGQYSITMTEKYYQLNTNNSAAQWNEKAPRITIGTLDRSGNLVSPDGSFKADPSNFQMLYNGMTLVRKSKNTEVKLKYVARDYIAKQFPNIRIAD